MTIEDTYITSDLALAATISIWYPLQSIKKDNPRRAEFVFLRDKNLDGLIERYWSGELQVSPQDYFFHIKQIKSRLYEEG
jgi:hypothetical protein